MKNHEGKSVTAIRLTNAEIQSGHDRVRWAEGLIKQLPLDHDGRNSWLANYGSNSVVVRTYPSTSTHVWDVPEEALSADIKDGEVVFKEAISQDAFVKALLEEIKLSQHPLYVTLTQAIKQAMYGKGERHGGDATPFLDQPWHHYAKLHGRGFLTGQAAKKLEEAASTRSGDPFISECLGAIVYIGMSIIFESNLSKEVSDVKAV